jgi:hypothetical protein
MVILGRGAVSYERRVPVPSGVDIMPSSCPSPLGPPYNPRHSSTVGFQEGFLMSEVPLHPQGWISCPRSSRGGRRRTTLHRNPTPLNPELDFVLDVIPVPSTCTAVSFFSRGRPIEPPNHAILNPQSYTQGWTSCLRSSPEKRQRTSAQRSSRAASLPWHRLRAPSVCVCV